MNNFRKKISIIFSIIQITKIIIINNCTYPYHFYCILISIIIYIFCIK